MEGCVMIELPNPICMLCTFYNKAQYQKKQWYLAILCRGMIIHFKTQFYCAYMKTGFWLLSFFFPSNT